MTHNADSARTYIEEKRIVPLAQVLATAVAYARPDDPVEFMRKVLTDLKEARDGNAAITVCFTEANMKSMFAVLDPFDKGSITRAQMEGSLDNFGAGQDAICDVLGDAEGPFEFAEFAELIQKGVKATLFPPE